MFCTVLKVCQIYVRVESWFSIHFEIEKELKCSIYKSLSSGELMSCSFRMFYKFLIYIYFKQQHTGVEILQNDLKTTNTVFLVCKQTKIPRLNVSLVFFNSISIKIIISPGACWPTKLGFYPNHWWFSKTVTRRCYVHWNWIIRFVFLK